MKVKLNTDADTYAMSVVASLQNYRSIAALLAAYADVKCPSDENFTAMVRKSLLPASYRSNPSALALAMLGLSTDDFEDSAGYQTPSKSSHVTVRLLRDGKPDHARRTNAKPSIKQTIKEWLELNLDSDEVLHFPIADIPRFLYTHPEQLTYQIKRESGTPIRIIRSATLWTITRK